MFTAEELRQAEIFASLEITERARLAQTVADLRLRAGEWLVREGEPPAFFVVSEGRLHMVLDVHGKQTEFTDFEGGAGEFVGEVALLLGAPFFAGIRALTPCRVARLDRQQFHHLIRDSEPVRAKNVADRGRIDFRSTFCLPPECEVCDIAGGRVGDIRADHRKNLDAVACAHHLAAPGGDAALHQQPVKRDSLIEKRIALVHADDRGRQPLDILTRGEDRPCERIAAVEGFDAVTHGGSVVPKAEHNPFVLDGRGEPGLRSFASNVGTERIEALNEAEFAIPLQLHADRERQIAAPAFAGDDDAIRVDVESGCIRMHPF